MKYYKLAKPNGWDFYTGKTINYRKNIGKVVRVKSKEEPRLCTDTVIHASKKVNDCFVGASLPCSVYRVEGDAVATSTGKCGFTKLKILKELNPVKVFKWNYALACNPVNPFEIKKPEITKRHIRLLKKWVLVRDSVGDSVWASVGDSVGDSVGASVGDSVGDSVWASVWDSVGASVGDSVRDSVWVYTGYIFKDCVTNWKYIKHQKGKYPFQCAVDLWNDGLVPSYDGKTWRLHGGKNAEILYEGG